MRWLKCQRVKAATAALTAALHGKGSVKQPRETFSVR